ncbi:MAG: hypothetical protein E7162_02540 [Firmicutes bacterium]|nr:hypothetical protein [Bacillota bacterium]
MKTKSKEKDIEKKEKKTTNNKLSLILDIIFILLSIASGIYLIVALFQYISIKDLKIIIYIVTAIIILFNLMMIINLFRKKKKKKRIKKSIKRFLLSILIVITIFIGYTLNYITKSLNNANKEFVTTSISLITLKENKVTDPKNIKNSKIAIGSDTEDLAMYKLPWEIINKYDIDEYNKILGYEDYASMIRDLYSGEVDYIFLPTNYGVLYEEEEGYETLEADTKILASTEKKETKEESELLGTSKDVSEPFTILLLGVDSKKEGIENADSFNGDAIILVTFNPDTLTATMLSIPRDTYVPIACFSNKAENKITHAAARGTKCVINTVQNYTGITIDYYAKINFAGMVDLVDALGGIEVDVPYAFCEQNSKRKWGKYTVKVEQGKQTLNGEQALALSRNRKKNTKGMQACGTKYNQGVRNDFVRGQNQQLVIRGIINKAKNIENVTKVYSILDAISNNMDTNMSRETILSFYNIAKDIMTSSKNSSGELVTIQKLYLAGSDQYIYDERSRLTLYNYIPNQDSKAKIIKAMKENLGLIKTEPDKSFNYTIEETYTQNTIGRYGNKATVLYTLIPDFSTYSRAKADSWALKNGFTITYDEVETEAYPAGKIYKQSYPPKKRTDLCNSKNITLTIAKRKEVITPPPEDNNNDNNTNDNQNSGENTPETNP